jgi:hypothetical protein
VLNKLLEVITNLTYSKQWSCYTIVNISHIKLRLQFYTLIVTILLLCVMPNAVNAAIINYDEAIGGDLNGTLDFGVLEEGIHQVTGQLTFNALSTNDTSDFFMFEIPVGLQITSGVLELSGFEINSPTYNVQLVTFFQDQPGSNPFLILSPTFTETTTPTTFPVPYTIDNNLLPVGPDSYNAFVAWSGTLPPSYDMKLDYRLSFTTSAVPVPAALWLFVSGIICLIGLNKATRISA